MNTWKTSLLMAVLVCLAPASDAARPPGAGGGGTGGGGSGTKGYVGEDLGTLPGDKYSDAWDVNALGRVVGRSYGYQGELAGIVKAFYYDGTTMTRLMPATEPVDAEDPPWEAEASAISGDSQTIAGHEERTICIPAEAPPEDRTCSITQHPVVWTADETGFQAARLGDYRGRVFGINDAGDILVGGSGGNFGALWTWEGDAWSSRTSILPTAFTEADLQPPFTLIEGHELAVNGTAWDVNDDGVVVGLVRWYDKTASDACAASDIRPCHVDTGRGTYLYFHATAGDFAAGSAVVLPVPEGFTDSSGYAVSNVANGVIYVAGWTGNDMGGTAGQGVRWTITLSGGTIEVESLPDLAWAEGVDVSGDVAGTRNSKPDRRGNIIQTAMLWKPAVGYIPLKPPKGGSDSSARAMATGTDYVYIVGEANASGAWKAARWKVPVGP